MQPSKAEALAWEERWARPVAVATLAAIGLFVAAILVATQGVGNADDNSELLRNVDANGTARLVSSILQGIAVGLLAAPLYYLFRAAKARSERVRGQLVGVVIAAPLFLTVAAILTGVSTIQAANDFVSSDIPRLVAKGIALNSDRANEIADDTITGTSLRSLAAGFALGGQLGFVVAMFYTALQAMRTGLLSRFWGSLGMALGAVSFFPILFQFAILWFAYLALLIAGWLPGSRPPAWQSGEAIPWPTPGEKAASELEPADDEENASDAEQPR